MTGLVIGSSLGTAFAGSEFAYLATAQALSRQLVSILAEAGICNSVADCQKHAGGVVLVRPLRDGVEISVYDVRSRDVAAKLLRQAAEYFTNNEIGTAATILIYEGTKTDQLKQPAFSKLQPTYRLRMEKKNGIN
jgi:hypothetical protein